MRRLLFPVLIFLAVLPSFSQAHIGSDDAPYKHVGLPVEQRVQDLLGRMTL